LSQKIGAEVKVVEEHGMLSHVLTWFPRERSKPVRQVITMFSLVNVELRPSDDSTRALRINTVLLPPWEELGPALGSVDHEIPPEPCAIDLSSLKLPDILDDVRECLYTSDDDLSSPGSLSESPPPLDDHNLKNITLISARRM